MSAPVPARVARRDVDVRFRRESRWEQPVALVAGIVTAVLFLAGLAVLL